LLSQGWFLYGFEMAGEACCDERQKTKHYGVSSDCLTAIEPILPLMINVGPQFPRMVSITLHVIAADHRSQGRKTCSHNHSFPIINPVRRRAISKVEGVSRVEFEIQRKQIFTARTSVMHWSHSGVLFEVTGPTATLTPLGTSISIEFPTIMVHETHTSSQHEHNVGVQPHGDRGELLSSSSGFQQGANLVRPSKRFVLP